MDEKLKELFRNKIDAVAGSLGDLRDKVVLVGGAAIVAQVDQVFSDLRLTEDIDLIIDANRLEYSRIEKQLRALGFRNDEESGVICRFQKGDMILDLMPIDPSVLGFSNRWYLEAMRNAIPYSSGCHQIKVVDFVHFVATKMEAFLSRGNNDFLMSRDIEDLVTVFACREGFSVELTSLEGELGSFIREHLQIWLHHKDFLSALEGQLPRDLNKPYERILEDLKEVVDED